LVLGDDGQPVYRCRRQGIWARVLAALQADTDARGELDWLLHLWTGRWCGPPARCRCQAAAGHGRPGHGGLWSILTSPGDRDREALGRSRGGDSTKLHLRVEGQPSFDKAAYRQRNHVEIVCTQVTKPRLGAAWGGRDHVADLHLAVGDHDPVDQQLHQLAALLEAGQAQTHGQLLQHPSHGLGDAADLDQPLTLGGDLPLAGQQVGLPPGKGPVLALEGGQVDHLGQVGLQQPLPLAGHAGPYAV
jgi:hypothetical protein